MYLHPFAGSTILPDESVFGASVVKPEMFIPYWDAVFQQFLDPYLDLDPFLFV
jgi:hypothetical protein